MSTPCWDHVRNKSDFYSSAWRIQLYVKVKVSAFDVNRLQWNLNVISTVKPKKGKLSLSRNTTKTKNFFRPNRGIFSPEPAESWLPFNCIIYLLVSLNIFLINSLKSVCTLSSASSAERIKPDQSSCGQTGWTGSDWNDLTDFTWKQVNCKVHKVHKVLIVLLLTSRNMLQLFYHFFCGSGRFPWSLLVSFVVLSSLRQQWAGVDSLTKLQQFFTNLIHLPTNWIWFGYWNSNFCPLSSSAG